MTVSIAGQARQRLVATYAEIGPGDVAALFGSTDHLEIARTAPAPRTGWASVPVTPFS